MKLNKKNESCMKLNFLLCKIVILFVISLFGDLQAVKEVSSKRGSYHKGLKRCNSIYKIPYQFKCIILKTTQDPNQL